MYKRFFFAVFFSIIIFSNASTAQESGSFQINGGFIYPMKSSNGLTGLLQFNYPLSLKINLYFYTGYSAWDKYKIVYRQQGTISNNDQLYFDTYSADDHVLVPFYAGTSFNMHTNKFFTSFLNIEVGYSYLSYNSYDQVIITDEETGKTLEIYADGYTRKKVKENLFGFGVGAGLSHPMTDNIDLTFSFKLNSFLNANYEGLFSYRGTYTMFLAGFNFNI